MGIKVDIIHLWTFIYFLWNAFENSNLVWWFLVIFLIHSVDERCLMTLTVIFMPTGNDFPSGHLVPSPSLGLAWPQIVETSFLELVVSFLGFSPWTHWIPLGTFSILLSISFISGIMYLLLIWDRMYFRVILVIFCSKTYYFLTSNWKETDRDSHVKNISKP